jgi:hypothetical protein
VGVRPFFTADADRDRRTRPPARISPLAEKSAGAEPEVAPLPAPLPATPPAPREAASREAAPPFTPAPAPVPLPFSATKPPTKLTQDLLQQLDWKRIDELVAGSFRVDDCRAELVKDDEDVVDVYLYRGDESQPSPLCTAIRGTTVRWEQNRCVNSSV